MPTSSTHRPGFIVSIFQVFTVAVTWSIWFFTVWQGDHWAVVRENFFMSITMAFGSFVAGATSEGGGAVAFPVMTMGFGILPEVARDFSLMIQSVGMSAATLMIIVARIPVAWNVIGIAGVGGAFGVILGLEFLTGLFSPAATKMFFVSFWLGFGISLVWINQDRARKVETKTNALGASENLMLFAVGMIGGAVSSLTGSGLDILVFSFLALYFHLSEKIGMPISVVLMALLSLVGCTWKHNSIGLSH
ncbi:MAG: sulfite exporter TauE/SafE family protein, partial [Proteobacteria bacterium]